jgi:putative hydrolase of HD superfamily
MQKDRLSRQLAFVREADKLKTVVRQTLLTDGSRRENSAEHSWHLALMAMILDEHADAKQIDLLHVIQMVLVHDLVEIDAGDTYCYDTAGNADKAVREASAADRLFNLLPHDQAARVRALWDEFEASHTPEAKFAHALDRLQPLMHNAITQGRMWRRHGITESQVIERNGTIEDGAPDLWRHARALIDSAVAAGNLPSDEVK